MNEMNGVVRVNSSCSHVDVTAELLMPLSVAEQYSYCLPVETKSIMITPGP